jgi:Protein of unknown function (DUF1236)
MRTGTRIWLLAVAIAWATPAAAQTPDAGNERTKQPAGQSGAAASHTITPGAGEPRQITGTATGQLSLSDDQRKKLTDYFSHPRGKVNEATGTEFTVSVGAAVPRQVALAPLAPELKQILPTYKNDQYVVVDDRLVIVTPDDRRIVAIIPKG